MITTPPEDKHGENSQLANRQAPVLACDTVVTINVPVSVGCRELSEGQVCWEWAGQGAAGWGCALGSHGEEGKGLGSTLWGG